MTPPAPHASWMSRWLIRSPAGQALLVFALALAVTGALVFGVAQSIGRQDRLVFESEVERTVDAIDERVTVTTNLIRGTGGLFAASESVTVEEFRDYVEALRLAQHYPGILGIGFTQWLEPRDVPALEARMRADGRPAFRVWPEAPREVYTSITHLEPMNARNAAALGFDMWTEPTRRAAMAEALATHDAAATARVTLVQEIDPDKQAGFLIYLPVYKRLDAGGARMIGFAYAPLRADDLFKGVRGRGEPAIDYTLHAGPQATDATLMRSTLTATAAHVPRFSTTRMFDVNGRTWTLRFYSRPLLDAQSQRGLVPWLALAALAASALLARLAWTQARVRLQAEAAATAQRDAALRLHRERAWLDATLTSIGDGVVAVDADGRVRWMNPVAERLTGWTRDVAIGQPRNAVLDLQAIDADSGPTAMLRARDGAARPVVHTSAPIREGEGEASGAVIVVHDASEQHRIEAELRDADRRKDEFLAMLAHELRNPLAPIGTAAALLQHDGLDAARMRDTIAVIARQLAHLTALVDDLLDVSRVTRGLITLDAAPLDLHDAIAAALEQSRALVEQRGHALDVDIDDSSLAVHGDRVRLTQVIANLLNNAAKYTPPGGRITLRAWQADGGVHVCVRDTGIGIEPALLPHVFDLFTQGARGLDRAQGGLGIGLALVRAIVQLHGGRVRAESAGTGRGSAFEVVLPAIDVPRLQAAAIDAVPHPASVPAPLDVVVVDDNADAAETTAMLLEAYGFRVRTHADAAGALADLEPLADAYVLDIGLPDLDGYELARRLRADPRSAPATLFALSGYGQRDDVHNAMAAGFAAHFTKPVDPQRLIEALARVPKRSG